MKLPASRFWALCVWMIFAQFACADVILQRDGNKLSGNIVKEDPASITIESNVGRIVVPRTKIVSVTREKLSQIQLYAAQLEKLGPNEPLRKSIDDLRKGSLTAEEQQAYRDLVAKYQSRLAPVAATSTQLASLDNQATIEAQKLFDSMQIAKGIERLQQELTQRPGQIKSMGMLTREVVEECDRDDCVMVMKFFGSLKEKGSQDAQAQANIDQGIAALQKHFATLDAKEAARVDAEKKYLASLPTPKPLPVETPLPLITPTPDPTLAAATPTTVATETESYDTSESYPVGLDPNAPVETENDDELEDEDYEDVDIESGSGGSMAFQIFYWLGFVIICVGGLWIRFLMFAESILWGIAGIFIPLVDLIFVVTHWEDTKYPFYIMLGGIGVMIISIIIVFM